MKFGDHGDFAIEVELENGLLGKEAPKKQILGRMCVWIGGRPFGDFDEGLSILGGAAARLQDCGKNVDRYWRSELEGLAPEAQFDFLNRVHYLAYRNRSLLEGLDDASVERLFDEAEALAANQQNPTFLLHSSEIFDGWKGFLIRLPDSTRVRIAWLTKWEDPTKVLYHDFERETFGAVISAFGAWFSAHDVSWRKRRRLADI